MIEMISDNWCIILFHRKLQEGVEQEAVQYSPLCERQIITANSVSAVTKANDV